MNQNQKGFSSIIIGIVVLVLAIVGGSGYYLINKNKQSENNNRNQQQLGVNQQTNNQDEIADETANWKIYRNGKYGFEIKYPSNVAFKEMSYGVEFAIEGDERYTQPPHPATLLFIHPEKVDPQESLESLIKEKFKLRDLTTIPSTTIRGKINMIENYNAHEWIQAYGQCHYFLKQEDLLIDIYRGETGLNPSSCEDDTVFNQMLSSFNLISLDAFPSKDDWIIVESLFYNSEISSPLIIFGKARGTWFFEGDFPIIITDKDGTIIAEGYASSNEKEWMTQEYVSFSGKIEFTKPNHTNQGFVIFKNNNPRDGSSDNFLKVPVIFK